MAAEVEQSIPPQKAVEIILTRQLASYLAMPVFLVDPAGNLLYYNEPAEALLGHRYDETGELPLKSGRRCGRRAATDGKPMPPGAAAADARPHAAPTGAQAHAHHGPRRRVAAHRGDGIPAGRPRRPAPRRRGPLLGEQGMRVTLWGTRGSLAAPGPETVGYGGNTACVEVRSEDGAVLVLDAGTGIRAPRPHPRRRPRGESTSCSPTCTWTTSRALAFSGRCSNPDARSTSGDRHRRRWTCARGWRATIAAAVPGAASASCPAHLTLHDVPLGPI